MIIKSTTILFLLFSTTLVADLISYNDSNESSNYEELISPMNNPIDLLQSKYTINTPYGNEVLKDTTTPYSDNSTTYDEEIKKPSEEEFLIQDVTSTYIKKHTKEYGKKESENFFTNNYDIDRQDELGTVIIPEAFKKHTTQVESTSTDTSNETSSSSYPSFPTESKNLPSSTLDNITMNTSNRPKLTLTPMPYKVAIKKAREDNKIILLEVFSDNCKYCKKMQDEVFSDQVVIDTINRDFIYMHMNGGTETLPLGLGLMGSPMHIFINKNEEKEIYRGFKSKDEFLALLRKISS